MKPFNLEEYLKNPSLKIVTREGKDARIICTNAKGKYPIVALIKSQNIEYPSVFTNKGKYILGMQHPDDLFFVYKKKERWINLYYNKIRNQVYFGKVFKSEEKAKKEGKNQNNYVITIPIEWEE